MAIFTVNNTSDSGSGSLRQAILDTNALSGKDIINFDGVFADEVTDLITLSSSFSITDDLSINATDADLLTFRATSGVSDLNAFEISSGVTVNIEGLNITNSAISRFFNNSGVLTLKNSNFTNNSLNNVVNNTGTLTLSKSTIVNNQALNLGFIGIGNTKGVVTVDNSSISNNRATFSVLSINNVDGTAIVSNSTLSDNSTSRSTVGIISSGILTISNSSISGNLTESSASVITNTGILIISNSSISGNGLYSARSGRYSVKNIIDNSGSVTVSNTTISNNQGRGIYNSNSGIATVNNSTISGNFFNGIRNNGTLTVNNSTITRTLDILNTATPVPDIGGIYNSGTATVKNSIIAGNSLTGTSSDYTGFTSNGLIGRNDVRGNFISNGYNLIGNLAGSTGFNVDEQIKVDITEVIDLTLRDNGGRVKTHALVTASPAINAGNNADVPADVADLDGDRDTTEQVPFDGRGSGFARISGGRVDIGGFEAVVNVINSTQEGETINGTADDDIITGFKGKNILTGGNGADAFVYTDIENAGDTITDFEVGIDKIVLRQLFESLGLANLNLITANAGGYLGFETQETNTVVLIDPDGSTGSGRAVKYLTVENVTANELNNAINFAFFKLPPTTPSIFTVTNTNDSGSGSLRQAILDANAIFGKDIIKLDGVFADNIPDTITLTSGSLTITDDLSIEGLGADLLTVSGNNANGVFKISSGVPVDIVGLTIANGKSTTSQGSGGIFNQGFLTLSNSAITNNLAVYTFGGGGGIYNSGTLTVNNSTISGNSSSSNLGPSVIGGGIYNNGFLTINNSTISNNSAAGSGGGIGSSGSLTINNSTISNNSAAGAGGMSGNGGGIYSTSNGTLTVNNSTLTSNSASSGNGIYNAGTATVKNSIIAGNSFTFRSNQNGNDVRGNFISNGYNLIGNLNDSTGFNANEQLKVNLTEVLDLTLQDNGGKVKTHALIPGSPAINAGLNEDIPADVTDIDGDGDTTEQVPFDGRGSGFARIFGGRVDIGGFEAVVNVINSTQEGETINGTADDDIITGFKGKNILTGGNGADAFVFTDIENAGDTITDFEVGVDKIVLRQLFESLGLASLNLITANAGGYLGFETQETNTVVLIDPDGTAGSGRAVKYLTVENVTGNELNNGINFVFPTSTPFIFTVTNTNDSGSGSLRQAILDADAVVGKDIIKFDGVFADNIPDTITLSSSLIITDDLSIDGTGADLLTVSGNNANRVFEISSNVPVDIVGLTIANGKSPTSTSQGGGSIFNQGFLTLSNSVVSNNSAPSSGGVIYNSERSSLIIKNSTISNNSGYGIYNIGTATVTNSTISGNTGSGIQNPTGALTVTNSTINGNTGNGIFIYNGTVTVTNSTISDNTVAGIYNNGTATVSNSTIGDNKGGGILNYRTATVSNSTITLNTFESKTSFLANFGGIYNYQSGSFTLKNSIVAGNLDNDSTTATGFNPDVLGNFISNGYNIIGDLNGSTGFDASEQLNALITELIDTTLQNNGGSVLTYALVAGSPAINAGNNADVPADVADLDGDRNTTEPVPFDGRGTGFTRISGDRVDIGAFEVAV